MVLSWKQGQKVGQLSVVGQSCQAGGADRRSCSCAASSQTAYADCKPASCGSDSRDVYCRRGEGWLPGQVAEAEPPAPCSQEVRPLTGVCLVSPKPGEPARLVFGEARDPAVLRWV